MVYCLGMFLRLIASTKYEVRALLHTRAIDFSSIDRLHRLADPRDRPSELQGTTATHSSSSVHRTRNLRTDRRSHSLVTLSTSNNHFAGYGCMLPSLVRTCLSNCCSVRCSPLPNVGSTARSRRPGADPVPKHFHKLSEHDRIDLSMWATLLRRGLSHKSDFKMASGSGEAEPGTSKRRGEAGQQGVQAQVKVT